MRPILVTGGHGTLGHAVVRACEARSLACRALPRAQLDITDAEAIRRALDEVEPWLVVNAAGYVRVDDAEHDRERCHRENAYGAANLAKATAQRGLPLVAFSTDLVFDGRARAPYREDDAPAPLCVYGQSKLAAERAVVQANPRALVVRTSAFFGPWDAGNFVTRTIRQLGAGCVVRACGHTVVSPTYVPDLVDACLDLAIDGESGIWHLANTGEATWCELGRMAARFAHLDASRVVSATTAEMGWVAARPAYSALASKRGAMLPPLEHALHRFISAAELGVQR